MTTTFALLCQRCGLSHREAAEFLNTRLDTARSWSSGRNRTPPGVIAELRALYAKIEAAAEWSVKQYEDICKEAGHPPSNVQLGLSSDDHEARQRGLPCVGAHAAMVGIVAARIASGVDVVPAGSTLATAAAAAADDRVIDTTIVSADTV